MLPHLRKTYLSPAEEGKFRMLDEYLDDHYATYVSVVVEIHKDLKEKFGSPPSITKVINYVKRSLKDYDKHIYDYLDRNDFPVRDTDEFVAQLELFTEVIVSEALPEISRYGVQSSKE
jgi:hypothetical protein